MARPATLDHSLDEALGRIDEPSWIAEREDGGLDRWDAEPGGFVPNGVGGRIAAFLPPCRLDRLGDPAFTRTHGVKLAYVSGAMANGIGSVEIVEAMGRAGMLGIFGAAGLPPTRVEASLDRLETSLGPGGPYGFNLIHSPNEPQHEAAVADLYLRRGVRLVEASAYLGLTLPIVRYRLTGIRIDPATGQTWVPNRVIAKVSRVEVAGKFLEPAPEAMVRELVAKGELTEGQAELARRVPMADDLTAEADSGGHTDNQALVVLLPTMIDLRDRIQARHRYPVPPRVGAAGGIATPWSASAALAMGAAYLVVGSVHQGCVESGTSDAARVMLSQAKQADIAMAPAADMFEMGVRVQVLKRGTLFAMRGAKLFEIYRAHPSLDEIPAADRASLEKTIFRASLEAIWDQTRAYFEHRDPRQNERAERDPKHKMALVFRWYLGQASHWANAGEPSRAVDYQIWCGPAMAAFNQWVQGSFLERPEERKVAVVGLNLLYGAAVLQRARSLASQGITLPPGVPSLRPLPVETIVRRAGNLRF